ncbi:hypothetical protein DLD77_06475 [Chitinophaga alhagiae]|uniref:Lipocalin-like domain-containing protein n=1 Tax=Chitinophaga alhagiae TaxID=2203219 RepID=A0ABM6WBZ4_9BACT|nr:hypothetical protein DLD77_06475 [Chitinophaga alhagiae]
MTATIIFSACNNAPEKQPEHNIVGEWDAHLSYKEKPYVVIGRFKDNGTYDAFIDGKLIVSGKYRTVGDSIYFRDGNCDMDYEGLYKLTYYKDSVSFNALQDTCQERVHGSSGMAMKRVKQ